MPQPWVCMHRKPSTESATQTTRLRFQYINEIITAIIEIPIAITDNQLERFAILFESFAISLL